MGHGSRESRDAGNAGRDRKGAETDRRADEAENREADDRTGVSRLQRELGNRALQRLADTGGIAIGGPDDPAEREAERVADRVVGRSVDDPPLADGSQSDDLVERDEDGTDHRGDPSLDAETEERLRSLRGGGRPMRPSMRSYFEPRFGTGFGDVRVHTGPDADEAARAVNARAFALGRDVVFRSGAYRPGTEGGKRLFAHELTHVVQQGAAGSATGAGAGAGNGSPAGTETGAKSGSVVRRQDDGGAASREAGESEGAEAGGGTGADASAGLSGGTEEGRLYQTAVDLRRAVAAGDRAGFGTVVARVTFTGSKFVYAVENRRPGVTRPADSGPVDESRILGDEVMPALNVIMAGNGGTYLITFGRDGGGVMTLREVRRTGGASQVVGKAPSTVAEALSLLKRAEVAAKGPGPFPPEGMRLSHVSKAVSLAESTGKYTVDSRTYEVSFANRQDQEISTIEDFILFVETVEETYPGAGPHAIASEIRQLWFADAKWDVMIDSEGLKRGDGSLIDIETEPNTIAEQFDMPDLAPADEGKPLDTPMGRVDVSHVMAGIDATLSGGRESYPDEYMEKRNHDMDDEWKTWLGFDTLKSATGGDPRGFATWSGDLGQAYGKYLLDRYHDENPGTTLESVRKEKAADDELLGDVHGYVATRLAADRHDSDRTEGAGRSVSEILRHLYLPASSGSGNKQGSSPTFKSYFEDAADVDGDLEEFVRRRTEAFAELWFYKGKDFITTWDYEEAHARNEEQASAKNKLDSLVDHFVKLLEKKAKRP